MLGISLYPDKTTLEEDIAYLKLAKSYGYQRVFMSMLQIDVNNPKKSIQRLKESISYANQYDMPVTLDIHPIVFDYLKIEDYDLSYFHELGVDTIRLDSGFNGRIEAMMTHNPYGISIELNMSNDIKYLDLIHSYCPNRQYLKGSHNFYPQKYTGLSLQSFMNCSQRFLHYHIPSAAFINSQQAAISPWQVSEGQCTLEMHRDLPIEIQVRHLKMLHMVDDMIIGNAYASEDAKSAAYQALHHQFVASAKAVQLAHQIDAKNHVGCMVMTTVGYPKTSHPLDILAAQEYLRDGTLFFTDVHVRGEYPKYFHSYDVNLDIIEEDEKDLRQGCVDFIGFSYYSTQVVSHTNEGEEAQGNIVKGLKNPYLEASEWGWQIDPNGLKFLMRVLYERYEKPLFIVENGLGYDDQIVEGKIEDDARIDYLRQHIQAMKEIAEQENIDLMGYTVWSPIDIVSAGTGEMKKRYGMIYVDKDNEGHGTLKRMKKKSFDWYKQVIASNGENLQ